jgi:hypothetical protein
VRSGLTVVTGSSAVTNRSTSSGQPQPPIWSTSDLTWNCGVDVAPLVAPTQSAATISARDRERRSRSACIVFLHPQLTSEDTALLVKQPPQSTTQVRMTIASHDGRVPDRSPRYAWRGRLPSAETGTPPRRKWHRAPAFPGWELAGSSAAGHRLSSSRPERFAGGPSPWSFASWREAVVAVPTGSVACYLIFVVVWSRLQGRG